MEILTKIALPLCTFLLGIVFTLVLKRYEQRKALIRKHAEESSLLLKDWYNQLHNLETALRSQPNKRENESNILSYVQERSVLPGVLFSLEVLKSYKESEPLVKNIEKFLELVTTYRLPINNNTAYYISIGDDYIR